MNRYEIDGKLLESDRWGANNQPSFEFMGDILAMLPVADVEMIGNDTCKIVFDRTLYQDECFRLLGLGFDSPCEMGRFDTELTLWWD